MFSTDTLLKQTVKRATVPWRTRQHGRAAPFFKQTQRQEKAPSGVGALRCDFSRLRRTTISAVLGMSITAHMSSDAEARRARVSVLVNIRLSTTLLGGREAKRLIDLSRDVLPEYSKPASSVIYFFPTSIRREDNNA